MAGPAIVSSMLAGGERIIPIPVTAVRDAYLGRASEAVHVYFDRRGGKLHFEFSIEDLSTHQMRQTGAFDGGVLQVAESVAKLFDPAAHAFSTSQLDAIEAWGKSDFARAVEIDPGFSTAWVAMAQQQMAANQAQEALATVNRALSQTNVRSAVDRARLQVLSATLRGDEGARDQALLELVRLLPNDADLASQLAGRFQTARRFDSAVRLYREVIRIDPENAGARNLLGYAAFFSGDLPAALRAFEAYGEFPGREANALDSQGEVLFMAGRFEVAERFFLQAHERDANLLQGGDVLKAAYARWLAGDRQQADKHFEFYAQFRAGHGDRLTEWRRAVWLFATGRRQEAVAVLESARGPVAQIAQAQLRVWERENALPDDPAALRTALQSVDPTADSLVRTLYARALLRSGQREQAKEWVRLYPLPPDAGPDTPDVLQRSFTFPLYLELRRALLE